MTALIYVDARKQVVEPEDLKVFAETNTGGAGSPRTRRHPLQGRASSASRAERCLNTRFWVNSHSKRKRQNEKPGNRRALDKYLQVLIR
jgi:hypothetical protein